MSVLAAHTLTKVAEIDAHEGPVYVAEEDALYFTTVPRDLRVAIKRLSLATGAVEVVRAEANMANGMTLAPDGRLLVCEQGTHVTRACIAAIDRTTGDAETLVEAPFGLPLNSPNDVVVKSDGTIWFTDPSYGFLQGFRPTPSHGDFVWRFDPSTGHATVVAADFDKPNGLAFSPDESVVYIGDSGANHEAGSFDPRRPHHIRRFDVADSRLVNDRLFAVTTPGFPDGIKVDPDGHVYASSFTGVQIFDVTGELRDEISLPGAINFTFGGAERNTLFITTDTAVWAAKGA
ncbi:MAG TPA: SMP-30/gluconolactonase/LRE family protein [Gaiellaceae bacterium]|jgi:gluconolactonase